MEANEIVLLLEHNWNRLREEFGDQWPDFYRTYRQIVERLPAETNRENLERAIDDICDLLRKYDFGRGLLQGLIFQSSNKVRIAKAGIDVLGEQEYIQQLCNRMTEIDSNNANEAENKDEDKVELTEEEQ